MPTDPARRFRTAIVGAILSALLLVTGCGGNDSAASTVSEETSITVAAARSAPKIAITVPGTLAAGFQELQAGVQGKLGLAIMAVGADKMVTFGDWTSGPAWSTIKVPLTIAALRESPTNSTYAATAAITASDNAAAETLWQSLGDGQDAARAVEAVLREGGDMKTTVPPTRTRSEYSAFGQTEWALADQVRFASRLPCLPQSATVISLMGQITSDQQWGLGAVSGADFKGGWGPDATGSYLVRQFGLIESSAGQIAVAFATQPDSGAFADGMTIVNRLAALVEKHLDELSAGSCG